MNLPFMEMRGKDDNVFILLAGNTVDPAHFIAHLNGSVSSIKGYIAFLQDIQQKVQLSHTIFL